MEQLKKRRTRVLRACENCRQRKRKCSGKVVCSECAKYGDVCVIRSHFSAASSISTPQSDSKEQLEIPDYLSVRGQNDAPEYFGPASNYSFVNQLNRVLQQLDNSNDDENKGLDRFGMGPSVLDQSNTDFSVDEISTDTMNRLLVAFLETWSVTCPIFEAPQLFNLASHTWKSPSSTPNDRALLYLVLALGASTSYFDVDESNADVFPLARGFFNLALHAVPGISSQTSFEAVRVVFLMSLCACALGDTALSYVYSGIAVRISLAIGLHKNSVVTRSPDYAHRQRVWVSIWQFEHYWSFCVGRPSSLGESVTAPEVKKEDFTYSGYGETNSFITTSEHMKLRVQFATSLTKINMELYSSKNDLLTILSKVEYFSSEIDNAYFASSDTQITQAKIEDGVEFVKIERIREWFWIRIYYLYIKLIIFRPFLIFSVYLTNTSADVSQSIRDKIKAGADTCVEVAIELSDFIIKLNKKVRMLQPVLFISSYLESTSTVLLFYTVSSLASISDVLARRIWNALQVTRSFLNGSYGYYIGSPKIMARDGLESLHEVLTKKDTDDRKTYLDKIMSAVSVSSPTPQEFQDEMGLEAFWMQTLDWISYS